MATTRQERYNLIYGNTARKIEPLPKKPEYRPEPEVRPEEPKITPRIKRNREKAKAFDFHFVCVLSVAICVVAVACFVYLSQSAQLVSQREVLAQKKIELSALQAENDDLALEINQSVDLTQIEKIAKTKYGMRKPSESHVIRYTSENGDYVRQYADIPTTD